MSTRRSTTGPWRTLIAVLAVPVVLVAAAAVGPPVAAAAGSAVDGVVTTDEAFQRAVHSAVRTAFADARLVKGETVTEPSALDASQQTAVSVALINVGPRASVFALRQVGAVRPVASVVGADSVAVDRPASGRLTAHVTQSAGLRTVGWTERTGVNYRLMGRGEVGVDKLAAVASALPTDASRPTRAAATAIATAAAAAPPAAAGGDKTRGTADGYVAGAREPDDDLNDEATLGSSLPFRFSNYTGLWQMILYSDLDAFPAADVDCDFGPRTANFTKEWQAQEGLPQTGRLDAVSRDRADSPAWKEQEINDGSDYVWRPGLKAYIYIHRRGPNLSAPYRWDVRSIFSDTDWHGAAYTYANFQVC